MKEYSSTACSLISATGTSSSLTCTLQISSPVSYGINSLYIDGFNMGFKYKPKLVGKIAIIVNFVGSFSLNVFIDPDAVIASLIAAKSKTQSRRYLQFKGTWVQIGERSFRTLLECAHIDLIFRHQAEQETFFIPEIKWYLVIRVKQ